MTEYLPETATPSFLVPLLICAALKFMQCSNPTYIKKYFTLYFVAIFMLRNLWIQYHTYACRFPSRVYGEG